MDAERVAGYHGTGFREATGREKEAGRHGPTGKRGAPTAPFPTVPEQRGGPGEIGRSGDSADIGGAADRGSVSVSRSTEPFEVVFDSEDPPAPGPSGVNGDAPGIARVDVRWEPLAVRDGCRPGRIPDGRWPSDGALVRSEQFVVNEAVAQPGGGVFAVHAPPGTGVAEVYGDLVAAIITERARRIADLPGPAAAFGELRTWSKHRVAAPNRILTGFEIVLAAPESSALTAHGLPPIGAGWREAATTIDYFASTARLADGVGAWAMLAARLGDGAANRAFAERWWRGAVRGTDVLFPAGESMAAALRRLQAESAAVDWQGAVARFRSALAKTEKLASERSEVAAAVTRISDLEQACEEASCSAEAAQARLADLAAGEPAVREALTAAEEEQQALLADLGAHQLNRPVFTTVTADGKTALRSRSALSIALAGGVRRGRNWRGWTARRRELRAACAEAELRREAAAKELQTLSASLAVAWTAVNDETAEVSRLTAEIGPLAEAVALARQRWGDHVPDGPAQAETEDAALIEWRETSAPWADEEYAASRAEVFLAALDLHKTLIAARADVFAANLGALMDLLCADPAPTSAQAGPEMSSERAAAGERAASAGATATPAGSGAVDVGPVGADVAATDEAAAGAADADATAAQPRLAQPRPAQPRPTRRRRPLRPRGSRSSWSCPWFTCRSVPSSRSSTASGRRRLAGCWPITPSGCPAGRRTASWDEWTALSSRATAPAPRKRRWAMGTAAGAATATQTTTDRWPTIVQSPRTRKATSPATTTTGTATTRPTGASKATAESESTGGSKPTAMGVAAVRAPSPMPSTARKTWAARAHSGSPSGPRAMAPGCPPGCPIPRRPMGQPKRPSMMACASGWARRSASCAGSTGPPSTCATASPTTGCWSPTGVSIQK